MSASSTASHCAGRPVRRATTRCRPRTTAAAGGACAASRAATVGSMQSGCPRARRATCACRHERSMHRCPASNCATPRSGPTSTPCSPNSRETRARAICHAPSSASRTTGAWWASMVAASALPCCRKTARSRSAAAAFPSSPPCRSTATGPSPGPTWRRRNRCAMATCRCRPCSGVTTPSRSTSRPRPTASATRRRRWRATRSPTAQTGRSASRCCSA